MKTYQCPFWRWEKPLCSCCEAGKLVFLDGQARTEYINQYCGNIEDWHKCTLAQGMERYYQRQAEQEAGT